MNPVDRSALIKDICQNFALNVNPGPFHFVEKVLLDAHTKDATRKAKMQ
jgi:hypothetical protein